MKKEGIKLSNASKRLAFKDNSLFDKPQSTPVIIHTNSDNATNPVSEAINYFYNLNYQEVFEHVINKVKTQIKITLEKIKKFLVAKIKIIPWTKLFILVAVGYVLLHKDMTFSVDLKSANPIYLDDDNKNDVFSTQKLEDLKNKIVPVSNKKNNNSNKRKVNPYAPASIKEIDPVAKAYIKKYAKTAILEMKKYGIPASIKLAQGLLESHAGRSRLARENNNHFGVKCFSKNCKKGHCSNFNDDHHKDFFRKYTSPWRSYRSHSQMIVSGRYKPLLKHGRDYRKWAIGLKKLGYATDKNYHNKLIATINKYDLDKLDKFNK